MGIPAIPICMARSTRKPDVASDRLRIRGLKMPMPVRRRGVFRGRLSGLGHEADCHVSAIEVTEPGGGVRTYTRHSVQRVSKPLPEGDYQLLMSNGEIVRLRYQSGHWLSPP